VATEIFDVSDYWKGKHLDSKRAFVSPDHVVEFLMSQAGPGLPVRLKRVKRLIDTICDVVKKKTLHLVGRTLACAEGGQYVAVLPSGKILVLTKTLTARRGRVHIRWGKIYDPKTGRLSEAQEVTKYWRVDDKLRRTMSFTNVKGAFYHLRRLVQEVRENEEVDDVYANLLQIENTLIACIHDYFVFIGYSIRTNERKPKAVVGPKTTTGKIVAVLPGGRALAVSSEMPLTKGVTRFGFIVGRTRLRALSSELRKKEK
jgi:hypothetical protein